MGLFESFTSRAMGLRGPGRPPIPQSSMAPPGALLGPRYNLQDHPLPEMYSSEESIERAYSANVYAYRCVNAIANSIAGCPFRAGDPVSYNYTLSAPLARLLGPAPGGPNPMWSSANLLRWSIASYVLLGKFAWAIERDPFGHIVGLWPLHAQYIKPLPALSGDNYFSGFEYKTPGAIEPRIYQTKDVVYVWHPSLADFRQPESPVNVARLNINIAQLMEKFNYNFLKNGGVPAHLITTPPFASAQEREGWQAQWLADFSGNQNAGKTFFAERSIDGDGAESAQEQIDVKTLGTTQRDAELNVTHKAENMSIALAFGVPMSILGDSTAITFSNAFQERRNYWLECLQPKAREIQDGINTYLAPKLGSQVGWFDTTGVPELRGDPAIPDLQAIEWCQAGIVTVDEIRADRGLPPAQDVGLSGKIVLPKPVLPAAQPALSAIPSDSLQKQAGAKVVPPAKAPVASAPAASRAIAQILESQVRNILNDQAASIKERFSSRRPNRRAEGPALDVDYWEKRTSDSLGVTLRAMGQDTSCVRNYTSETASQIEKLISQHFGQDDLLEAIGAYFESRSADIVDSDPQVSVRSVSETLMDMASGDIDVDQALSTLEMS